MSDRWDYDAMFIDGAWTADDTVGVIEVIDPATEEVIGSVPDAGLKATHAAIAAARDEVELEKGEVNQVSERVGGRRRQVPRRDLDVERPDARL